MVSKKVDAKIELKSPKSNNRGSTSVAQIESPSPTKKVPLEKTLKFDASKKTTVKTKIVVKYDVGFQNQLFIRGSGADLSWERGNLLRNTKSDEWIWECNGSFSPCEFKILINDQYYELGENHPLECGASIQFSPKF